MANVVKLKRSSVPGKIPTTSQLDFGEVALNTYDGAMFFRRDNNDADEVVEVVTTTGTQTLTNKTLGSSNTAIIFEGDLDLSTSGVGIIDDQNSDGTNEQILTSTGTGVRWRDNTSGNLSGLGDVSLSGLTTNQILKYNGTIWVNADESAAVSSAVFAANASSDLGLVTDSAIDLEEDLEPNDGVSDNLLGDVDTYYNMGSIAIDGVVGLRNVDQSLKSDYISYSIIFGF